MEWAPFDTGSTVGQRGSEDGTILRDEEHELGARITLERDTRHTPFAITCGIYGWMFHTRFLGPEAEADFDRMKDALSAILVTIPMADDPEAEQKMAPVTEAISAFVDRFP